MLLFIINSMISANEADISKFYLRQTYQALNNNQFDLAIELNKKACSFSSIYPECYYFSNLLLENNRENILTKRTNALNIEKQINNAFLITKYELLKHLSFFYSQIKEYKKSDSFFTTLLTEADKVKHSDYNSMSM